jgi:hypothetical protein
MFETNFGTLKAIYGLAVFQRIIDYFGNFDELSKKSYFVTEQFFETPKAAQKPAEAASKARSKQCFKYREAR